MGRSAIIILLFSLFSSHISSAKQNKPSDISYNFGVVPQFEQRKLFKIWRPILDKLEQLTGFTLTLSGSAKIPVFEQSVTQGKFAFAYMNPYHALIASNSQAYTPLVKDGSRLLKGILVVNKDSGINSLEQLSGEHLVFPSPNALGASLLMRAELKNKEKLNFIPRYVQTHSSVYLHVATDLNKAGGGVISTLSQQKSEVRDQLKVLYTTSAIAPHPVMAHKRVPKEHQEQIKQAFITLSNDSEGKVLLAKIPMNEVITATQADYQTLNDLHLGQPNSQ